VGGGFGAVFRERSRVNESCSKWWVL